MERVRVNLDGPMQIVVKTLMSVQLIHLYAETPLKHAQTLHPAPIHVIVSAVILLTTTISASVSSILLILYTDS